MHRTYKLRQEQLTECQLNKPACYRLPQSTNVKHGITAGVKCELSLKFGLVEFY